MRILLMLPYDTSYKRDTPDLGLGYLAACLEREGHEVQICLKFMDLNSETALSDLISRGKFDVFGIKVMSCSIMSAKETIRLIRIIEPHAPIILGGPHVSGDPHSIFHLIPEASYAFHGESEVGLVKFINRLAHGGPISDSEFAGIPNLVWRKGPETMVNDMSRVEDLDTLPFPAWELMKPASFVNTPFGGHSRRFPIAPLIITRGCPNSCTFCEAGVINGHTVRSRSVESVIAEIKLLMNKFGVKEIQFFDSNCSDRRGPLRELCKRIISENLDISWSAPNGIRIDSIDAELVALMKKSGCFYVGVGIESGSPRILREIKKGLSLDLAREKIALLRKAGIGVTGYFMIGFPGETAEEIKQTISFAMKAPLTGATFSIFCPLPGTEIYKKLYKDQNLEIEIISSLDFITYKNNLSEITYSQLRKLQKQAISEFYLRPSLIVYFLRELNNIHKIRFVVNSFYEYAFKG
ncbi:MAG: radical SAM protein [Candidatus Omnitrophica bacterium]|nr:radical SAM protein [Candidatus Omnitrophota bacterium]